MDVAIHKNAVIIPIKSICKPYFIMLSSLILARYTPSTDKTINVSMMQLINAVSSDINPKFAMKKGDITVIAAIAGDTPSTKEAKIVEKR